MARTRFLQGLDELRARLLRMGGLAEQAVDRACQAYIERDLTRCRMGFDRSLRCGSLSRCHTSVLGRN